MNPGPFPTESTRECFSVVHLNVRSIRNKMDYIIDNFLDFDVICFTETHLSDNIENTQIILERIQ